MPKLSDDSKDGLIYGFLFMIMLFILFSLLGCQKKIEPPKLESYEANALTYQGFYLKALQTNEDGTYRITLYLDEQYIEVISKVSSNKISIRNNQSINAVYKELDNGQPTGRYVIYLQAGFLITKYYI